MTDRYRRLPLDCAVFCRILIEYGGERNHYYSHLSVISLTAPDCEISAVAFDATRIIESGSRLMKSHAKQFMCADRSLTLVTNRGRVVDVLQCDSDLLRLRGSCLNLRLSK